MDHPQQALMLHIPHSATAIPQGTGYVVDEATLHAEQLLLTDRHTDDLFASPTDIAIAAPFSRIFCDVERFANDAQEVMAGVGMGVLYTHSDAGMPQRNVRKRFSEADIVRPLKLRWWDHDAAWITRHVRLLHGMDIAALENAL